MTDKNKITIPISDNSFLVYRVTNMSKAVLLVKKTPPKPGAYFSDHETEQALIATTPAGCQAIGEALIEMGKKIRAEAAR